MNVKSEFIVKPTVRELLASVKSRNQSRHRRDFDHRRTGARMGFFPADVRCRPADSSRGAGSRERLDWQHRSRQYFNRDVLLDDRHGHCPDRRYPLISCGFSNGASNGSLLTQRSYFPGIFEACLVGVLRRWPLRLTRCRRARRRGSSRLFGCSPAWFLSPTSPPASRPILTLQQLRGDIKGPEDLARQTRRQRQRQHFGGISAPAQC